MATDLPKYQRICAALKEEILGHAYDGAHRFPSEIALSRRFGVGRTTVKRALDELHHQGLIRSEQGRGTFVTRLARARKIGLILSGQSQYTEFFRPIIRALVQQAQTNGYELVFGEIFATDLATRLKEARALAQEFVEQRVSGVIYHPLEFSSDNGETNRQILAFFGRAKVPAVLIDSDVVEAPDRSAYDLVSIDNESAGAQLVRHMMSNGARDVHFLMRPNWIPTVKNRARGAMAAKTSLLGDGRVRSDVLTAEPDDIAAVRRYLKRNPTADAFVCQNDSTAAVFRQTLAALGRRVPEDVMLAGFDDVSLARAMTPPLTTIHQPCERLAEVALKCLVSRLSAPSVEVLTVQVSAPLVVRASTRRRTSAKEKP